MYTFGVEKLKSKAAQKQLPAGLRGRTVPLASMRKLSWLLNISKLVYLSATNPYQDRLKFTTLPCYVCVLMFWNLVATISVIKVPPIRHNCQ